MITQVLNNFGYTGDDKDGTAVASADKEDQDRMDGLSPADRKRQKNRNKKMRAKTKKGAL